MSSKDEQLPSESEATLHLENVLFLWQHARESLLNLPDDQRLMLIERLRKQAAILRNSGLSSSAVYIYIADMLEAKVRL